MAALDDFLDLVLAARTEAALRHFLEHVVTADGFDLLFLGIFVVFVVVLVAFRGSAMIIMGDGRMFFSRMLGVMRILGMGGVFDGVLLVVTHIMRGFVMAFGGFGGRRNGFHRGGL